MNTRQRAKISESVPLDDNPQWYKDAVIYEIHVRAYCDGNGDGIGDFAGLTEKLEFLQDLGVTVLWLLPFYPSPLKDDGYDIADYANIHPDYGTLQDFRLSPSWSLTIPPTNTRGFSGRARPRRAAARGTFTSGATPKTDTKKRESSSKISSSRIGHWTRWQKPTTGIAFTLTSLT